MEEFTRLVDLASARFGGKALAANDDFFAPKENLVSPEKPLFIPGKFTPRGKWMDGWETRRRREPGFDWCLLKLGMRGIICGVNIDAAHFVGNQPESASLEALDAQTPGRSDAKTLRRLLSSPWTEILPRSPLRPGTDNVFPIASDRPWTHVRLNIFPDGGVARLRVHGVVSVDWGALAKAKTLIDLAAVANGGRVLEASDEHFGRKDNLITPGRAPNMGDGWETRRRRGPGFDWAIIKLGGPGRLERVEVDTNHFKGNYPESFSLGGCLAPTGELPHGDWSEVLPRTKLQPSRRHRFSKEIRASGPFTHVRLNIYPDGGVSRLRLHGRAVLA